MKTQWKILKDLPGIPAGTISTKESADNVACFGPPEDPYSVQQWVPFMKLHPDWFQEIKPRKIMVIECEFEPVGYEPYPVPVAVLWRSGPEDNTWLGSRPQPTSRVLSYRIEER